VKSNENKFMNISVESWFFTHLSTEIYKGDSLETGISYPKSGKDKLKYMDSN
jgi:hypothetical protein